MILNVTMKPIAKKASSVLFCFGLTFCPCLHISFIYPHSQSIYPAINRKYMLQMTLTLTGYVCVCLYCAIGDLLFDLLGQLLCNSHNFIHHKEPHVIQIYRSNALGQKQKQNNNGKINSALFSFAMQRIHKYFLAIGSIMSVHKR